MKNPNELLRKYWGFSTFREQQLDIINTILTDSDTIVLLPTGGGKSICFQIPGLIKEGVCIVISPLIALIKDQIDNLDRRGIKALHIPSGSSQNEIVQIFEKLKYGDYKFLYLSPERIQSTLMQNKIKELNISFFAIDEAHCISEWGHDFRPSYTKLSILKKLHPNSSVIALTATATGKVVQDIKIILDLDKPEVYRKSFLKKNLGYQVLYTDDKLYRLHYIFTKNNAPAIVYVNSRKRTREISGYLNHNGFKSTYYHGGLTVTEKEVAYTNWMNNDTPIIVATNAFGMGIDRADVQLVIHYDIPYSIENYVQETGRAGRNQEKSYAIALTNKSDLELTFRLFRDTQPSIEEIKIVYKKLYQYYGIAKGELVNHGFDFNILEFCHRYQFIPRKTFNILQILHNFDIIALHNHNQKKSAIQFIVSHSQILNYKRINSSKARFINTLLRTYGGLFEKKIPINEFQIARYLSITSSKVIAILDELHATKILNYRKPSKNSELFFLYPREDDFTINKYSKKIKQLLKHRQHRIKRLINYIKNKSVCRSIQLLHYFEEKSKLRCGICDICLNRQKIKDISREIIELLKEYQEISSRDICLKLNYNEKDILIHLRKLLTEEKITITNYNTYLLT